MDFAFRELLTPGAIGVLTVRNRMVMPPMGTNYGSADGYVTQRSIDYYEARSAGGVGLIIVEVACVDYPRGRAVANQLAIDHDRYLPGLSELAAAIKAHGARAMVQLHHAGREAHIRRLNLQPVAPSPIRSINPHLNAPRELARDEIQELIGRFVEAAERARHAGFDGVELHGAHSYLIGQFLSALCNARTDEYGGPLLNRARVVVEIVQGIRRRLSPNFSLSVRLSGDEFVAGGITIEECCAVAQMLETAGADAIHVSGGGLTSPKPTTVGPAFYPPGHLLHLPARVKRYVRVPVIGVGRLNTPAAAEAALRDGKCDFVALGRALIVDPEFPNKVADGRTDEIRPCHACMNCVHTVTFENAALVCSCNPAAGRERELALRPVEERKRVFVIGGGVAGLEAASVAALRGHAVTLYEKSNRLGGQLIAAAVPPLKGELSRLRDYYVGQVAKAGVETRLGQAPAAADIAAAAPDAVIVATGSRPRSPDIPGSDAPHVVYAEDVLLGRAEAGQRVVVVGGELVGCETAEYLAAKGKQVTLVRRGARLASGILPMLRRPQLDRLAELKVVIRTGVKYEAIDARGLAMMTDEGKREFLEADTIVLAAGSAAVRGLAPALEGVVPAIMVVGDAVQPRRLLEAIHEGRAAGLAV